MKRSEEAIIFLFNAHFNTQAILLIMVNILIELDLVMFLNYQNNISIRDLQMVLTPPGLFGNSYWLKAAAIATY
jgi:hypothetical protein